MPSYFLFSVLLLLLTKIEINSEILHYDLGFSYIIISNVFDQIWTFFANKSMRRKVLIGSLGQLRAKPAVLRTRNDTSDVGLNF